MKTDPRTACANAEERLFWAVVHDMVAHPLMAATNWAGWAIRFHDWTSQRAWPREGGTKPTGYYVSAHSRGIGWIRVDEMGGGIYRAQHPTVAHVFVTKAGSCTEALYKAEAWFQALAREFGGQFANES